MVHVFTLKLKLKFLLIASRKNSHTPKFCGAFALIQEDNDIIVLPCDDVYASDFCKGNFINGPKSTNGCTDKLKMPELIHYPIEGKKWL